MDEVQVLTGLTDADAIIDWVDAQRARAVALKLGPAGCRISHAAQRSSVPGHLVTAVDATAAVDCFAGACLSQLACGKSLAEAAQRANLAAALSTQGFGAVNPPPRLADLAAAGARIKGLADQR